MKYKNDTDDLIQSDLEALRKEEPPKNAEGLLFRIIPSDEFLFSVFGHRWRIEGTDFGFLFTHGHLCDDVVT